MVNYNCNICDYITKRQYNYNKHLNTKKHINNEKSYDMNNGNYIEKTEKKDSKGLKIKKKGLKKDSKGLKTNLQIPDNSNKFVCEYCNLALKTRPIMLRHIKKSCKKKQELYKEQNENKELQEIIKSQSKQISKIEKKLEKNGKQINNTQNNNSNNTINNTIHINNYGEENLEMLTDEFKEKCVTRPFYAILEIIKKIHFNDDYPENKNMRLVNKRDNKIQVLDDGKWKYRYKDEAVKYAFDDSNERLEQFCIEKSHKFRKFIKLCCEDIIKNIHECEPELMKELYKEMDLILLNGC
jgi:hypothetical protein